MQTPISQIQSNNIQSNNAQSSNAAAAVKKNTDSNKALANPDNDFQRTLARQIEQRQALKTAAQNQANQANNQTNKAAPVQPGAAKPAQPAETRAAEQAKQAAKADGAPKSADQVAAEEEDTPQTPPPSDPAADMLALMANMKQALTPQPVAATPAETAATLKAAKGAAGLASSSDLGKLKPDGAALPDATDAPSGKDGAEFAAGLDAAQAKGAKLAELGASGQAAPDAAALAAKAKDGMAEQMAAIKEAAPDAAKVAAPVQQASLQVAEVATSIPADKLQGRVGTPAWDQQLGQKVVWMVGGGEQSATLTLNPPDLGPLQVVLKVTNEQTDAAFTSSQPEVRQALEAAMPRLREIMSEAGIQFGNATVSAGTQEQQNQASADARSSRGGGGRGNGGADDGDAGAVRTVVPARRGGVEGMVDTFA